MSLIRLYPENPDPKKIAEIVDCLKGGGVIIYPTDTVYGFGCDIFQKKAIKRVAQLKGIKPEKANFSFMCTDLSQVAEYSRQINNQVFKMMKQLLPGPYTFILEAAGVVPKHIQSRKRTVGIRVPDNNIATDIVEKLGHPMMNSSIRTDDDIIEYITDPELIYEKYKHTVDIVVNGGFGLNEPSTVIDCTVDPPEVIREGIGSTELLNLT